MGTIIHVGGTNHTIEDTTTIEASIPPKRIAN